MKIERVNIIGAGNVGTHLAKQIGYHKNVVSIFSRKFEKARSVAAIINARPVSNLSSIPSDVDLNIISVADDAIIEVINSLPKNIPIVHTSGSVNISIFEGFDHYGILYPLQTFSKDRAIEMSAVPFLIETNSEDFERRLINFASECFSEKVEVVDSEKRKIIHLGAVIAANFSNHLLYEAEKILNTHDLPFDILEPLMKEAVRKAFDIGPEAAQTGPAKRGDKTIIKNHLKMLSDSDFKEVYKALSGLINPDVIE